MNTLSFAAVYGDADADNVLTANDASVVLQNVLVSTYQMPIETTVENYMDIVDADADGSLSAADSAMILQKVLISTYTVPIENKENTEKKKSVVIYFSRAGEQYDVGIIEKGNTAIVAEIIAEESDSDIFEIKPLNDTYPTSYNELTEYAKQEQTSKARPEIESLPDISQYDTIYLGYPIWWGDMPMIMYTLLENTDLSGKTLIPFSTHAGSGLSGTESTIKQLQQNSTFKKGLAVRGSNAQNLQESVRQSVKNWLEK